ncbi:MAG: cache domain-containing protein [Pseudomonadota bacterium]
MLLLATLPLIIAASAIYLVMSDRSRLLVEEEIAVFETAMLDAKKAELRNAVNIARSSFAPVYGRAEADDEAAQLAIARSLAAMTYGRDGSFFVYTFDGEALVNPRRVEEIGRNLIDVTDPAGRPTVAGIIAAARDGDGFHRFSDAKPSTGEVAEKIVYAVPLSDWRWVVGTSAYIDDIVAQVAASRAELQASIRRTALIIVALTLAALAVVFVSGLLLNLHERRLADAKQRELTQRVIDAQEEERARVARELHDGISQMLVGVKFAIGAAARTVSRGAGDGLSAIGKSDEGLDQAIAEVRRISRDLRPGVLDDLGLVPALESLCDEFAKRNDIAVDARLIRSTRRFLPKEARTALYRVAQEALTNVERHARAETVRLELRITRRYVTLEVEDDGVGMHSDKMDAAGIGHRNMRERIEQLGGVFHVHRRRPGVMIEAKLPREKLGDFDEELEQAA